MCQTQLTGHGMPCPKRANTRLATTPEPRLQSWRGGMDEFVVRAYSFELGGYPVYQRWELDQQPGVWVDGARIATFVLESDAVDYCEYRNNYERVAVLERQE